MRTFALLLLLTSPAVAQTNPYERMLASQAQVMGYLKAEARRITASAGEELGTRQSWETVAQARRREMRDMLGLEPPPPKTALNVRITGTIDRGDYVIEKIAFESLPKIYVTANLYIPKAPGPKPTVLYVCGHAMSPHGAKTVYQRHGHTLAKHGYVAMLIDPIQIAETFALHHGVLNNEMEEWYARGYTPAGLEIWNMIRAMDYLETRPEVDPERFGVTGRSGGAAMSWFSASVDERLKAVVPVMGISTYAANLEENTQNLHCDCMFAINSWMQDMLHQGGLIAPRPLLMAHGRKDKLFPVPGYEAFERAMNRLYDSYGQHERFRNLVVDTGHEDSDFLRAEAVKWFDKFLAGVPAREIDVTFEEVPPEELRVFGGKPPADALNYRAHELFIPPPAPLALRMSTLADWETRRAELLAKLRERVFGAFPAGVEPTVSASDRAAPGGFEALTIRTEPGIEVEALFLAPKEPTGPSLLYIASDGEDDVAIRDTLRQIGGGGPNAVLIVRPRGVGEVGWPKKARKDMDRNAMHLGRSVDSMRLWDVLQAARVLREKTGTEVTLTGIGVSAALALYAGVLDEQVTQVILFDPPSTHVDGPAFLNVLRYTDLPEAAALMAPRRVTFYSRVPEAYRATQGVFALYGKPDHFALTMSLEGALNGRFDHAYASGL